MDGMNTLATLRRSNIELPSEAPTPLAAMEDVIAEVGDVLALIALMEDRQ
jgi:hypothetical protein